MEIEKQGTFSPNKVLNPKVLSPFKEKDPFGENRQQAQDVTPVLNPETLRYKYPLKDEVDKQSACIAIFNPSAEETYKSKLQSIK